MSIVVTTYFKISLHISKTEHDLGKKQIEIKNLTRILNQHKDLLYLIEGY